MGITDTKFIPDYLVRQLDAPVLRLGLFHESESAVESVQNSKWKAYTVKLL